MDVEVQYNVRLEKFTTFRLGGYCRGVFMCQTPAQLVKVVKRFHQTQVPFILIGGGSNLLVSDQGVDCFVIRYMSDQPEIVGNGHDLIVSGSTQLDHLVLAAIQRGLEGLNFASGIPGTVGGAVVGNAGAFGKQVGDVVKSVTLLTRSGLQKDVPSRELKFSYRNSILKSTGDIVLSVEFSLHPSDKMNLNTERNGILEARRQKHPDLVITPCAGSFFRNIEPTSLAQRRQAAGWFLEQAGGKALRVGGACIFDKHANIIIKENGACAQDVFALSELMAGLVKEKFNLELIREVRLVGKFKGMPEDIQDILW
ncbi:MAG TPA: UDP-N-acetylenolpyruvoylglucosamine reductase [Candidatus Omnitrophica bacterium]|nr:MAG: UDP-N-acetylenolpyruvoylglucosamine reductase [Omnitrophica WOR_2 bacterium GWA2_45_18]HBR15876.1 UDP-N-acetylenolpyruvoylglucosamine reductase [Candidatus Omnitrophota bacterium]